MPHHLITPADFHAAVAAARALAPARETLGFFGPESVSWRILGASVILAGGARAGLLQLAHPAVAQAIADHSDVARDVQGRLRRTLSTVYTMVFGDQATAVKLAGRVFAIHQRIAGVHAHHSVLARAGEPYHATRLDGLMWVAATLRDTAVQLYELAYGPQPLDVLDRFTDEQRRVAALFGVPLDHAPRTWAAHRAHFERVLETQLEVTPAGRRAGDLVLTPARPSAIPAFLVARPVTAALMPHRLRAPFDLPGDAASVAVGRSALAAVRAGWRHLPARIQECPALFHARRRLAGKPGPDRVALALRALAIRALS